MTYQQRLKEHAMSDNTVNPALMALLDQYAQESGFADLADLKHNYTDRAYAHTLSSLLRRATSELHKNPTT
jgi:hypothetical protein